MKSRYYLVTFGIILILVLTIVFVSAANTYSSGFYDSFENGEWNSLWTETGEGDWVTSATASTTITKVGTYVASVNDCDTNCNLTSININCAGYQDCILTYNWGTKGLDADESIRMDIYNVTSSVWKLSVATHTGTLAGTDTINLTQYGLGANNAIRISAVGGGSWTAGEYGEFDAVNVTRLNTSEIASTCTYSGSGEWNVNCADYCNFSSQTLIPSTNNVVATGTGTLTFNNGGKWTFTGTGQKVIINSGCKFVINSGGGFF